MSARTFVQRPGATRRSAMTLVEIVLALGLLAILMVVVFRIFDRTLSVWRRGETRRALLEQASSIGDMLARDLRVPEAGRHGDLLAEWIAFDTDGDGVQETAWPRLRMIRQGSARDVARIRARAEAESRTNAPRTPSLEAKVLQASSPELIEIVWMVTPASLSDRDARAEGVVWRGERVVGDEATKSFFAPDFFGPSHRAPADTLEELGAGLLWMDLRFAAQTSVVSDGWDEHTGVAGSARSWDAWDRDRPSQAIDHPWNRRFEGMPKARERALVPRRVRIELEFERAIDRLRRARTAEVLDNESRTLLVDDATRLPDEAQAHVKLDGEWLRVRARNGRELQVDRAQRGTQAVSHAAGTLVHFGVPLSIEVTVATYREDWDL